MSRRSGAPSERVRVRRLHERARYDAETVHQILDANPLCHVAYNVGGTPYATPTMQWREGDKVYWHGSSASRFLRSVRGTQACLTVTLWDGFVMARSAFHHSANYRSVMVVGQATQVTDEDEKVGRLNAMVEKFFPGRWDILRPITAKEVKATMVLGMPLTEASAKIRTGPPVDDEEDYALPIWAGILPLRVQTLQPQTDPRCNPVIPVPEHVMKFSVG